MIEKVRLIKEDELNSLLPLYAYLNLDDPVLEVDEVLKKHWNEIISNPDYFYLVAEEDGILVSTCNLTVIRNLTREARPYGLIENVVTHPDYRKRGYGTAVLKKAVEIARERGCYKVMLLTSQKR
jgi:GNAT superfamily N-acetyltransferase